MFAKRDRIYAVRLNWSYGGAINTLWSSPRPLAPSAKRDIAGVANSCRLSDDGVQALFRTGNRMLYATGRYADSSLFSILELPFEDGNPRQAFAEPHALVLTKATAEKLFGTSRGVVGRTVQIDNKDVYTVTAVIKDLPKNCSFQFEWLIPFETEMRPDQVNNWGSYSPTTLFELDPQANPEAINRQLYNYLDKKQSGNQTHCFIFPMRDWHLRDDFADGKYAGGGRITLLHMLTTIGWIILLIACVNFVNLATAGSERRAREIGVRKVLGAERGRLIIHFMREALLIAAIAGLLGVLIVLLALPFFNDLVGEQLVLPLISLKHAFFIAAIISICGLAAGIYPAVYLSSFEPVLALKGRRFQAGSSTLIRKSLVILQFSLSVLFIISTLVIYRQMIHVKNRDLGFSRQRLLKIELHRSLAGGFSAIRHDLLHTGFVENAARTDHDALFAGNNTTSFSWEGKAPDEQIVISHRFVSPEFFATAGLRLLEGRNFFSEQTDSTNIVITESLARHLTGRTAVGQVIESGNRYDQSGNKYFRVIGVVNDYIYGDMYGKSDPVIFFCKPPLFSDILYVKFKTGKDLQAAVAAVKEVVSRYNPDYPFEYSFADDQFNAMFQMETMLGRISSVFATLAILISCLGLFGLAMYTAERRLKEVSIRKVLGAGEAGLAVLLSKDFLMLIVLSCLISIPLAWWVMNNWLQHYAYRINLSWWIFLAAGLGALLIALITISFRTVRAAMANPVDILRAE